MLSNTFFRTILIAITIALFISCSEDKSVNNDDDNKNDNTQALAANNTMVIDGEVHIMDKISQFHQSALDEVWIFVYGDDYDDVITIKLSKEIPTASGTTKLEYRKSVLAHESNEFSMGIKATDGTNVNSWVDESSITGVKTTGNLYVKQNANGTRTVFFNNLTLGDKHTTPTMTKKFSGTFTFSNTIVPEQLAQPTIYDLVDDK
ncbi:MAG: hypothetical protein M9949_03350 [Candidatus Kapabacteria bacterium]|nr:hypothetical protein [Candidatus Kapabacteria bacterium]